MKNAIKAICICSILYTSSCSNDNKQEIPEQVHEETSQAQNNSLLTFDEIIENIKQSEEYKIAAKNPSRETSGKAVDFILYKSGLTPYFNSLGEMMNRTLHPYYKTLENINEKLADKNIESSVIQNAGSRLNTEYKILATTGKIHDDNFGKDLKTLTDLVVSVTIPIID